MILELVLGYGVRAERGVVFVGFADYSGLVVKAHLRKCHKAVHIGFNVLIKTTDSAQLWQGNKRQIWRKQKCCFCFHREKQTALA